MCYNHFPLFKYSRIYYIQLFLYYYYINNKHLRDKKGGFPFYYYLLFLKDSRIYYFLLYEINTSKNGIKQIIYKYSLSFDF